MGAIASVVDIVLPENLILTRPARECSSAGCCAYRLAIPRLSISATVVRCLMGTLLKSDSFALSEYGRHRPRRTRRMTRAKPRPLLAARSTEIGADGAMKLSVEETEKADIMPTNHYA